MRIITARLLGFIFPIRCPNTWPDTSQRRWAVCKNVFKILVFLTVKSETIAKMRLVCATETKPTRTNARRSKRKIKAYLRIYLGHFHSITLVDPRRTTIRYRSRKYFRWSGIWVVVAKFVFMTLSLENRTYSTITFTPVQNVLYTLLYWIRINR